MKIWKRLRAALPAWLSGEPTPTTDADARGDAHLTLARESLREILKNATRCPADRGVNAIDKQNRRFGHTLHSNTAEKERDPIPLTTT